MKIYKLSRQDSIGYDEYDSCVVYADNEDEARTIHPSNYVTHCKNGLWYGTYSETARHNLGEEYETENGRGNSWVDFNETPKLIIEHIGEAKENAIKGVICASFNAG